MRIEEYAVADSGGFGLRRSGLDGDLRRPDGFRMVAHGRNSLAISPAAISRRLVLALLARNSHAETWSSVATIPENTLDKPLISGVLIEFEEPDKPDTELDSSGKASSRGGPAVDLEARLHLAFEAEPVEDGMDHPAEDIICGALAAAASSPVLEWLRGLCLDATRPHFSASVLRCLSRQPRPGTSEWRIDLVGAALKANDPEIRDAAVQAAEHWRDAGIREVLRSHNESLRWLRSAIEDVIEDLGE